jgi:hypothetical protein
VGLVGIEQKGTQRFYFLSLDEAIATLKQLIHTVETTCGT